MVPTYAMFDSGASCSAISLDLVNKIGVDTKKLNIRLGTFDHEIVAEREVTSFLVSNLNGDLEISVENASTLYVSHPNVLFLLPFVSLSRCVLLFPKLPSS